MEIRTVGPEEVRDAATQRSLSIRNIPIDEIDSAFKSKYIGTSPSFLSIFPAKLMH